MCSVFRAALPLHGHRVNYKLDNEMHESTLLLFYRLSSSVLFPYGEGQQKDRTCPLDENANTALFHIAAALVEQG